MSNFNKVISRIIEIFRVKGLNSFQSLFDYLQPEYEGRRLNRKIQKLLSDNIKSSHLNIYRLLIHKYSYSNNRIPGLEKSYILLISELIVQNHMGELDKSKLRLAKESTKEINYSSLDSNSWQSLLFLMTANGLFEISYHIRDIFTTSLLSCPLDKTQNKKRIVANFNAAVEQQDFQQAENAIYKLSELNCDLRILNEMKIVLNLYQGKSKEASELAKHLYTTVDFKFSDYLTGKRIAIVGPAPNIEKLNGEEIDQYDVVIRTNYRGVSTLPPVLEFGKKIDVSYYNYTYTKQVLNSNNVPSYLCDLKFAIFKNQHDIDNFTKNIDSNFVGSNLRKMNQLRNLVVNGKSQMMQNIMFDLLHFEPSEIKLFNANFFMSEKRYHAQYDSPTNAAQMKSNFWLNFATHDLETQLNFTRRLYNTGLIKADTQVEKILHMRNENYMQEIMNIYSSSSV